MPEWVQIYSKAITALLTSLVMAWIRSRVDVAGLGGDATLQTVISMSLDGLSAAVIGGMTWLIPLGEHYWHEQILGEKVKIITSEGTVTGTVVEVKPADPVE